MVTRGYPCVCAGPGAGRGVGGGGKRWGLSRPGGGGGGFLSHRRGEETLGETPGPRPLPPRPGGGRAEALGAAFPQASEGGGLQEGRRERPPRPAGSSSGRQDARGHDASRGPSRHCRRPLPSTAPAPRVGGGACDLSLVPALRCPARPGPAQPASTHGSDSSRGSSPAQPASPPPTPGPRGRHRIRVARGQEGRNTWGLCTGTGSCRRPASSRR